MGANFSSEPVVEKYTERDQNDIFTAAVSSCQGWRLTQEDEHSLILDLPGEHKASFFAVFDGHGSGRVSKHASVGLWRHLTENDKYIKGNFKEALEESFLSFDREVMESYNCLLAGTTAICVLIVDNVIYCANIGDSRAVASINCECVPLSSDHKPDNPLELKRILEAGGYVFGNRVNGNLALSRAFGDFHYKQNDHLPADQQIVSPQPDVKRIELNDDVDFIVLACDGIWDVLSSKEVVKFVISHLEQNIEPGLICEQLTTRCIATDYELVIGCDNMTVLLVCHTRGRSWTDYCTDIFNKNTEKLGVPRTRVIDDSLNQTLKLDERVFGSNTSSSEYSQDTSMNRTFTGSETSTDSDISSSEGYASASSLGAQSIIEIIKRARNISSASGSDPNVEVTVAEDTTSSYLPNELEPRVDPAKIDCAEKSGVDQSTTTTEGDQTKEEGICTKKDNLIAVNEDKDLQSVGTTEIYLSKTDQNEDSPVEPKNDDLVPSIQQNSIADDWIRELEQKIVEIELQSPETDIESNENREASTQEELPEVVNDILTDEQNEIECPQTKDEEPNDCENQDDEER